MFNLKVSLRGSSNTDTLFPYHRCQGDEDVCIYSIHQCRGVEKTESHNLTLPHNLKTVQHFHYEQFSNNVLDSRQLQRRQKASIQSNMC